jgi:hypothetical protein
MEQPKPKMAGMIIITIILSILTGISAYLYLRYTSNKKSITTNERMGCPTYMCSTPAPDLSNRNIAWRLKSPGVYQIQDQPIVPKGT